MNMDIFYINSLYFYPKQWFKPQIQTRDVEGPFDHICTCIYSPLEITFSVGTSQYKVAIGPLKLTGSLHCDNRTVYIKMHMDFKIPRH